jgi:MFS family permease
VAQRSQVATVYASGVVQGLALVTFPAASAVFTAKQGYGLSNAEFGLMFLPQAATAILASLAGMRLRQRLGLKRIYQLGLLADLLAMALLGSSRLVQHDRMAAYGILLAATGCMGVGFGCTVPALNTLAATLFPRTVDQAVLALNALLGLGTALAPALVAVFVGLGMWWGLPLLVSLLLVGLLLASIRQVLPEGPPAAAARGRPASSRMPGRFWIFAGFALLYGVCETMNGNWATILMAGSFGASAAQSAVALTAFWAAVTGGRVLFAAIDRWLPDRRVFLILPVVLAGAFVAIGLAHRAGPAAGIAGFALAGLGCSALLPLAISFGQQELAAMEGAVAGGLIAAYQVGYGLAAFSVGPLLAASGWAMSSVFAASSLVAALLSLAAVLIGRGHRAAPP